MKVFFMCSFRSVKGDCSRDLLRKSVKAGKVIEEQIKKRAFEKFYEEVKDNDNLIERDYYIGLLKKKGFAF
jgi:hypothetical protein